MNIRVTITMDKDLQRRARKLQAQLIRERIDKGRPSVSFSFVVGMLMEDSLKKYKIK